jgi:hypothetical protein
MSPRLSGSVKRIVPEKRADFDGELMSVMHDRRRCANTHLDCHPEASASI